MLRGRLLLVLTILPAILVLGLTPASHTAAQQPPPDPDELLLRNAGLPTDGPGLLEFFRKRSLKDTDRKLLEKLVADLDHETFKVRKAAMRDLVVWGRLALPLLKQAEKSGTLEMTLRAKECIKKIEGGPGPEQPAAAARLLAQRKPDKSVEVLLNYLPSVDDEWLEDEILTCLGTLFSVAPKERPVLLAALKDRLPEKRGVAGYVLAQRGDMEQRELVRPLLADDDLAVRGRVAAGLVGKRVLQNVQQNAMADEALLRNSGVNPDGRSIVEFLRKRSLDEEAQATLREYIRQLGDGSWRVRQQATKKLLERGQPAVPFLKIAVEGDCLEASMRAGEVIKKIKQGPGPALPSAAVRVLARTGEPQQIKTESDPLRPAPAAVKTDEAIQALLTYAPFADDESVEEEVLNSLSILGTREASVNPQFLKALQDPLPPRRAAAAYVLGHVGRREHCHALQDLLGDAAPKVRLRAAQGLLAARDRAAVPTLIDLLAKAPDAWVWRIEEQLQRVASNKGPDIAMGDNLADYRKRASAAWAGWWRKEGKGIDLARLNTPAGRLGLNLIVEYDQNFGGGQGKAWECGRDKTPRWTVSNLLGPMDAQILPNNRLLVAENNASRVTERDIATGNIVWTYQVASPVAVERLPNGNTWIATYNNFMEITPDRNIVYNHRQSPNFIIFSAKRLRNGHIVAINSMGTVYEFDPAANKNVRSVQLQNQGNWCGVEKLANGRYLVATMTPGEIREIDANGNVHWKCNFQGVFRATRLPNGNTMAVSMTTRQVVEFDRNGNRVWETMCNGRPWMVHTR